MASITPGKTSNGIDRGAVSGDRSRRNWQRLLSGALNQVANWATGKGQILVSESASSYAALPAGTNGYVLTAESSQPLGVEWLPGGGGVTVYTASGSIATGGTLVVTHAADTTNERLCYAAAGAGVASGPDLTGSGTASGTFTYMMAGASGNGALYDHNSSTAGADPVGFGTGTTSSYDFGAGNFYNIQYLTFQYWTMYFPTGTQVFQLQYSDDGMTWTNVTGGTFTPNITISTVQSFGPFASSGNHRYWQITYSSGVTGAGTNCWVNEVTYSQAVIGGLVGPVIVGNTTLDAADTDRVTAEFTSSTTTTFTNQYAATLPLIANVIIPS